jgi:hypothetical protein
MKAILAILTVISICSFINSKDSVEDIILHNFQSSPTKESFKIYYHTYRKTYDLYSDVAIRKYENFKESKQLIESINKEENSYKLALGPYSDMSNDDFAELLGIQKNSSNLEFYNDILKLKNYKEGTLKISYSLIKQLNGLIRDNYNGILTLNHPKYGEDEIAKISFEDENIKEKDCAKFYVNECKVENRKIIESCKNELFWSENHKENVNIYGYELGGFDSIVVFNSFNCSGATYTDNKDRICLTKVGLDYFDRRIQSFVLLKDNDAPEKGCILLYPEYCLLGEPYKVCGDNPSLPSDLKIRSIRNHPGQKYVLHDEENFKGSKRSLLSDVYHLFVIKREMRSVSFIKN